MRLRRRPLTIPEILCWADAYREATGKWPTVHSGGIAGTIGDSWNQVGHALREGLRSLPGGSSLARLLAEHRGKRNLKERGVDAALRHGLRGLAGKSSLAQLLTAQGQTASVSIAQTLAHPANAYCARSIPQGMDCIALASFTHPHSPGPLAPGIRAAQRPAIRSH
jgi:hypothetical protein